MIYMKSILKLTCEVLLCAITITALKIPVYSEGKCWYLKRNGTDQPIFNQDQTLVSEFDGYYMDTGLDNDSEEKRIYLTFDFGYENGNVERIADVLREERVPAAFFILDHPIIENKELILSLAADGHFICNHTKNHKDLSGADADQIKRDLLALEEIYERETGLTLSKYFRFPEGRYSVNALKVISDMGYKTVFWSFAYDDWDNSRQPSSSAAIKKILSNTHNGAVILLHPTSSVNVEILPTLIKAWRSQGYTFGTLDQLVESVNR